MEQDELITTLHNSVETLSTRIDKLEEVNAKTVAALEKLDTTITQTNKVFDEVSEGIKGLYEKAKQLEVWSKLIGNLGSLAPLISGLGGLGGFGGSAAPGPKKP
jgi:uncharacterized coiled-coil protein SlyX